MLGYRLEKERGTAGVLRISSFLCLRRVAYKKENRNSKANAAETENRNSL